jgi:ribonucleotide reductase alpha subunit
MNVDHANDHSSFKADVAPVKQSNLCCEITLPTKPLKDFSETGKMKKRIRVPKEKYAEFLEYKKHNHMLWLTHEKFNSTKST